MIAVQLWVRCYEEVLEIHAHTDMYMCVCAFITKLKLKNQKWQITVSKETRPKAPLQTGKALIKWQQVWFQIMYNYMSSTIIYIL